MRSIQGCAKSPNCEKLVEGKVFLRTMRFRIVAPIAILFQYSSLPLPAPPYNNLLRAVEIGSNDVGSSLYASKRQTRE